MLIKVEFADNYLSVGTATFHARAEDVEAARLDAEVEVAAAIRDAAQAIHAGYQAVSKPASEPPQAA